MLHFLFPREYFPSRLEILLAPVELHPAAAVVLALHLQGLGEHLRPAVEHADLGRVVHLAHALEDGVPVGAAEVGGGAQARDGVLVRVGVVQPDVGRVRVGDLGGEVLEGRGHD